MLQISPYFRIIRWPNLLIIVLTQVLYRICILEPFFGLGLVRPVMSYLNFGLLILATVCIAAGGYIINDLIDESADRINKPDRMIAGKRIPTGILVWYYRILSGTGMILGFYLAIRVNFWLLGFIFPVAAGMLWYYSSRYQKKVLVGNVLIGFLSALVLIIVWLFEVFALFDDPVGHVEAMKQLQITGYIALAYALFAFLATLSREIMKDAEDLEGDRSAGYLTLPVVYGEKAARRWVSVILFLLILLLGFCQYLLVVGGFMLVFWYLMIAVQPILLYQVYLALNARAREDYRFLSLVSKLVMVAGILSMQLFYISL